MQKWQQAGWLLVLANLAGFLLGVYYYQTQLEQTPAWAWLVVMDCPVAAGLFALTLALALGGRGRNWLNHLAGVFCLKTGVWTLFAILYFGNFFLAPERVEWYGLLALLHVGLLLEGLWVMGGTATSKQLSLGVLALLLAGDWLDYGMGLHPILPTDGSGIALAGGVAIVLSLLVVTLFHLASRRKLNLLSWLPIIGGELRARTVQAKVR